jgi:adenylate cyclase
MAEKRARPKTQPAAKPQSRGRGGGRSGFPRREGSDEEVSLTGKKLSQAALSMVMRAIPDELVREITAASAPLTRYSGRSRIGAAALARGLKLLAQPPAAHQPITGDMTAAEIAERVDRPVATINRWAGVGLLGSPIQAARVRKWARAGLENARLVDYLLRHGVTWEILLREAREGRLPQLVLAKALGGRGGLTRDEVARRADVPVELAASTWRALGAAAPAEPDDPVYSSAEVEALRLIGAMRSTYSDEDLIEATSVVGRAMHEVAEAVLELFRRRIAVPFAEAGGGELEIMLRLETAIDITVPTMAPLLELALRRQLEATSRAETILRFEAATGAVGGQVHMAVGFADIVGFTAASSRLSALEVSQMAETLLKCAEVALPQSGARMVKSIGDAVMFVAPDLPSACAAAASLLQAADQSGLPPLRVGVAFGPMLRAYADYFGRTVNIASRLSDVAPAGEILALRPADPIPAQAWEARRLEVKEAGKKRLRGVDGRVEVLRVTRRR